MVMPSGSQVIIKTTVTKENSITSLPRRREKQTKPVENYVGKLTVEKHLTVTFNKRAALSTLATKSLLCVDKIIINFALNRSSQKSLFTCRWCWINMFIWIILVVSAVADIESNKLMCGINSMRCLVGEESAER